MRKTTIVLGSAALAIALGAGSATAAPGDHHGGPGALAGPGPGAFAGAFHHRLARLEFMAEELGLSDEQLAAARERIDLAADQARPLVREMADNRRDLRAMARDAAYDEAAVAAIAGRQGDLLAELIVLKTALGADLRDLLTPEQLDALEARRARRLGG